MCIRDRSSTVSVSPLGSVVSTRPVIPALSRRLRYTVVVAVEAAEAGRTGGTGVVIIMVIAHNTTAAARSFRCLRQFKSFNSCQKQAAVQRQTEHILNPPFPKRRDKS